MQPPSPEHLVALREQVRNATRRMRELERIAFEVELEAHGRVERTVRVLRELRWIENGGETRAYTRA